MKTILTLRRAVGEAVDELPSLAGTAAFAAKEAEIETLERSIADLERAERRSAGLARPASGAGRDASEINPSQRTISQIRAMDPRPGKLKGFDDYQALARKGLDFTPRADSHYRSFGEQLQSIFKHYASKGSDTDPRLVRAPTGASEVDPTGGGFLVQMDFAVAIFMLAHDMGDIPSGEGLSKPGEPPHGVSGKLARSIHARARTDGEGVTVRASEVPRFFYRSARRAREVAPARHPARCRLFRTGLTA